MVILFCTFFKLKKNYAENFLIHTNYMKYFRLNYLPLFLFFQSTQKTIQHMGSPEADEIYFQDLIKKFLQKNNKLPLHFLFMPLTVSKNCCVLAMSHTSSYEKSLRQGRILYHQVCPFNLNNFIDPFAIASAFGATLFRTTFRTWKMTARTVLVKTVTDILTVIEHTPSLIVHLILFYAERISKRAFDENF